MGNVAYGGGMYLGLVGKHEVKRPCERCKYRWENHINIDVQERGWEVMNCIIQTQSRQIGRLLQTQ